MNVTGNGTHTSGIEYSDRGQVHDDLLYLLASLLLATLSALVASFLGLHRQRRHLFGLRRRQRRDESASTSPIHRTRSRTDGLWEDEVLV